MFRQRIPLCGLLVVVAFAITTTARPPQEQPRGGGGRGPTSPLALKEIAPRLYMVGNSGGNSIVRVTDNGVVLVDTKLPGEGYYNQLRDLIKVVSDQPVRY